MGGRQTWDSLWFGESFGKVKGRKAGDRNRGGDRNNGGGCNNGGNRNNGRDRSKGGYCNGDTMNVLKCSRSSKKTKSVQERPRASKKVQECSSRAKTVVEAGGTPTTETKGHSVTGLMASEDLEDWIFSWRPRSGATIAPTTVTAPTVVCPTGKSWGQKEDSHKDNCNNYVQDGNYIQDGHEQDCQGQARSSKGCHRKNKIGGNVHHRGYGNHHL